MKELLVIIDHLILAQGRGDSAVHIALALTAWEKYVEEHPDLGIRGPITAARIAKLGGMTPAERGAWAQEWCENHIELEYEDVLAGLIKALETK